MFSDREQYSSADVKSTASWSCHCQNIWAINNAIGSQVQSTETHPTMFAYTQFYIELVSFASCMIGLAQNQRMYVHSGLSISHQCFVSLKPSEAMVTIALSLLYSTQHGCHFWQCDAKGILHEDLQESRNCFEAGRGLH